MPHLHIEEFKEINFPQKNNEVSFNFIARNAKHSDETLISVSVEEDDFFLLVKAEENKNLLKTDKLTRPASIHNVHRALLAYADLADLNVISSNVPQKQKNIHLEEATALKHISYFADSFPQASEIRIEVGFGSGRHLIHQATQNPDILFIGIEIHRPSIEQVLKQVSIQNIENLLVLDYDARLFMELVPSNIVGKIYVHFPVPWDKKPHRRVISTSFIEESRRVLKVDGRLELRTDSENYYAYSYETFINFHKTILNINKNKDIAVSSKYEDRWKKMEKNIYDVTMINEEESDKLSIEGTFEFSKVGLSDEKLIELHCVTQRFDGGFIHFERVYKLDDGVMLRISLGSFDRPEHLYVLVKDKKASYYPTLPLKSISNLLAHKYLDEVFNG
ncbi:tRNA (guanine-N(7))-methyltransferase [Sulfurimonas gotlandica GD1]|uniref:tRNA (guanine-N(7)-)-methyltransferase n=1 Tax=Sulfurimonas gotlandica (strain DSM 19862 / JCM 16533 / GD1) TaxID=929558 RepID=B6BNM5_SULGG|nr:tRNA (guanosine(46)-N7)-methyltransferase TrmB [Sulfurimonas gotlandica]EDZ61285.1 tRNA (guanine-N(7)-)-methyltransferase (tRNA(m7G46)-methyltransferase) [Sulfurimonas gotlandica GD1]EHP28829.1 tRNA (guanine-N(7))-methyltransferase [Sulfurimonas gotlandica GD1]